jgi:hypothetical protein
MLRHQGAAGLMDLETLPRGSVGTGQLLSLAELELSGGPRWPPAGPASACCGTDACDPIDQYRDSIGTTYELHTCEHKELVLW